MKSHMIRFVAITAKTPNSRQRLTADMSLYVAYAALLRALTTTLHFQSWRKRKLMTLVQLAGRHFSQV